MKVRFPRRIKSIPNNFLPFWLLVFAGSYLECLRFSPFCLFRKKRQFILIYNIRNLVHIDFVLPFSHMIHTISIFIILAHNLQSIHKQFDCMRSIKCQSNSKYIWKICNLFYLIIYIPKHHPILYSSSLTEWAQFTRPGF